MSNYPQTDAVISNANSMDSLAMSLTTNLQASQAQVVELEKELAAKVGLVYHDFNNLELQDWVEEANVGNTGSKPGGHGHTVQSIAADGSRQFDVTPGPGPNEVGFDNAFYGCHGLFIPRLGQIVRVDDTIKFKVSDITKIEANEWENHRSITGRVANMAFCVDPTRKRWAYFNYNGINGVNGDWVTAPIPYDAAMFSDWVKVVTVYEIDDDAYTKIHRSAEINGTLYPLNITYPQSAKQSKSRWDVNFQLGSKGCAKGSVPPPFTVNMFRSARVYFNTF